MSSASAQPQKLNHKNFANSQKFSPQKFWLYRISAEVIYSSNVHCDDTHCNNIVTIPCHNHVQEKQDI